MLPGAKKVLSGFFIVSYIPSRQNVFQNLPGKVIPSSPIETRIVEIREGM